MADKKNNEFLEEQIARVRAEAESFRLQADAALKYSEQVWWSWDLNRRRLKIRSVDECILGYQDEDLDRGEQFWWEKIHPEDLEEVEATLLDCLESRKDTWRCEHRFRDKAGDWVWVEQSGFVLQRDANGNAVEMVGTTRKTQERYQLIDLFRGAEAMVEAMAISAPICICVRDQEGVVLLSSHELNTKLGDTWKTIPFSKLTTPEMMEGWQKHFHSALQGERVESEITLKLKDGGSEKFAHHLIPVIQREAPFAVLEIFLPKGD